MICRLCKQAVDPEHPETCYGVNPLTYRPAWMHGFCFELVFEELEQQPCALVEFDNEQDRYLQSTT